MSSTTGANKIIKPGYHIRPKYDLHGFRRRRTSNSKGHIATELPLTSMIDMFSILVIYLLMNFSTTGDVFFMNKGLPLPKATKVSSLQSGPLISIVGEEFTLDAPSEYEGGGALKDATPSLESITGQLRTYKDRAAAKNMKTDNRVNVQAGEDTPIGLIKRAMTASVSAGWTNINFVVEKNN
jgi:biopolymer transport protein ExbD